MKKLNLTKSFIFLALLPVLSISVHAETPADSDLKYDSVSTGYSSSSITGYSARQNFMSVSGNYLYNGNYIIGADYGTGSFAPAGYTQVNYSSGGISLGYRIGISRSTDVVLGSHVYSTDITQSGYIGVTQTGYSYSVGVRTLLNPKFEFDASLASTSYQNATTTSSIALMNGVATSVGAGLKFHISDEWAIRGGYGYQSYKTSSSATGTSNNYNINLNYYFK